MHREVLENLESIQGALLRVNRSIQAEGAFGVMKQDRRYRRIVRRGINSVRVEILLVCIGHMRFEMDGHRLDEQNDCNQAYGTAHCAIS